MDGVPEALTTGQVAKRVGVSPNTVRAWIKAGKLPAFRVGERLRVRTEDVGRMVADATNGKAA